MAAARPACVDHPKSRMVPYLVAPTSTARHPRGPQRRRLSVTRVVSALKDSRVSADTQVAAPVRKTALNAVHRQLGAKMVDFNGWDMPVEYPSVGGLMKEHLAVRNGVGVFDVSHMGDIRISGPQALEAVQHITMNDAAGMGIGQCRYSAMLYPEGTFRRRRDRASHGRGRLHAGDQRRHPREGRQLGDGQHSPVRLQSREPER